jgi:hypothetical protein
MYVQNNEAMKMAAKALLTLLTKESVPEQVNVWLMELQN